MKRFHTLVPSKILVFTLALLTTELVFAQDGVLIDYTGNTRDNSAVLDVRSSTQGFLAPRVSIANLTTALPVTSPANGLLVYNTNGATGEGYYYWNGSAWTRLISGNATPLSGTGVANKVAFWTSTTNLSQNSNFHWDNTNIRLGIGTSGPTVALDVVGRLNATSHISSTSGNLHTNRGRLAFSNTATDANHSIYNNYANIDGEGGWDGMKMNVYNGLNIRVGNAGATSALYIDNTAEVGIGTTNPLSKLHVKNGKAYVNKSNNDPQTANYANADLVLGDNVTSRSGYTGGTGSHIFLQSIAKSSITALDESQNLGQISYENLRWTLGENVGWGNQTIRVPSLDQDANRIVMADANGDLYASSSLSGTGLGDNLGNHIATTTLTTATPSNYSAVTSLGYIAPIAIPQVNTGGGGFVPILQATTLISSGYRKHINIGSYRTGSGWGGGIYLAQGGNDNYPTEYFLLGMGGAMDHSSGSISSSGSLSVSSQINSNTGFQISNAATSGNYLRGNGTNFVSSAIVVGDLPSHTHPWTQVTAKPAAWLDGSNLIATLPNFNNSVPSGFYQGYNSTNAPGGSWYNLLNVRHSNTANDHGFQIAASYYDENVWTRTYSGGTGANDGTYTTWRSLVHSGNISANAILNQTSQQPSSNYNISGAGVVGTTLNVGGKLYMNTSLGQASAAHGISWYRPDYVTWYDYMAPAGSTNAPNGTAAPSDAGSGVTSWARRFNIENNASYGWLFESGPNNSTAPTVKFAINAGTGTFHSIGNGYVDGSVGIGTTTPSTKLTVAGGHGDTKLRLYSTGNGSDQPANLSLWASEPGITYYGTGIGYNVNGHPYYGRIDATRGSAYVRFLPGETKFEFQTAGGTTVNNVMVVKESGNVGIGLTNPTYKLHVNGAIRTLAINETSDIRMKKDITELSNSLDKVLKMRGVNYNWRKDEFPESDFEEGLQYGLIAQELEKIIPELVETDSEGWKSIEYSHLVPLLIEAIKEQQVTIQSLSAQNTSFVQQMDEMKAWQEAIMSLRPALKIENLKASSNNQ